jgi:uncharacterized protein YutE (UPF0331/DUF86 family)
LTGFSLKGSDIMDERIKEHLKYLNRYYLLLLDTQKMPHEDFIQDEIRQASVERFFQLAIESCLNIGNRLLSLFQFKMPVETPETYADIFRGMQKLGIVDEKFADRLVRMAKFRNVLVHLYWEIDHKEMDRMLQENLEDFILFRRCVVEFLKKHSTAPTP